MKLLKIIGLSILVLLAFWSCFPKADIDKNILSETQVAMEVIEHSGTCTLISLDSTGHPRARVMDPFPVEDDFVVWFGTNPKSRKVAEINNDARVVVHYYDKPNGAYVSVYGEGEIITDKNSINKYWKSAWQTFYPKYPNGYALIKVIPSRIEVLSESHGILGDSITWQPASIEFKTQDQ